jgi:hypothetical protein
VREVAKKAFFLFTLVVLAVAVPWLLAEGVYSVTRGAQAETSFGYALFSRWLWDGKVADFDAHDPNTRVVQRLEQIEQLVPALRANGVGMGNSPFKELKTEEAGVNREDGGCLEQKPNQRKVMSFLRSILFNPFDQATYFHDRERTLPPELETFFSRYGFRNVRFSTNELGERITLPAVASRHKVLIAGDSVANGVLLDDAETVASQLQALDSERQYINLGVARAASADIVCLLDRAAERYRGTIERLIYVFCENDFAPGEPYGSPQELVRWLTDYQRRQSVAEVTLVYVPYIYNVVPEVTRIRGHSHFHFPTYGEEKRRLLELAKDAGFGVIDFFEIADREAEAVGSQFAPLALYLDHTHLSALGVRRLTPSLAPSGSLVARK